MMPGVFAIFPAAQDLAWGGWELGFGSEPGPDVLDVNALDLGARSRVKPFTVEQMRDWWVWFHGYSSGRGLLRLQWSLTVLVELAVLVETIKRLYAEQSKKTYRGMLIDIHTMVNSACLGSKNLARRLVFYSGILKGIAGLEEVPQSNIKMASKGRRPPKCWAYMCAVPITTRPGPSLASVDCAQIIRCVVPSGKERDNQALSAMYDVGPAAVLDYTA